MNFIGTRKCTKRNRSEKTKSIIEALNCTGQTRVEYFKDRLWGMTLPLGKVRPAPVGENDEWNLVKVAYQGRDAFEIFYSRFGCSGHIFDENFDEIEHDEIKDALARAEVLVLENYIEMKRRIRWLGALFILGALLIVIDGCIYGDKEIVYKFSFFILLSLISIWLTYWDRICILLRIFSCHSN